MVSAKQITGPCSDNRKACPLTTNSTGQDRTWSAVWALELECCKLERHTFVIGIADKEVALKLQMESELMLEQAA